VHTFPVAEIMDMLHLSDIIPKHHTLTICKPYFTHKYLGTHIDYLHTRFFMPHSNGSLVTGIKWKAIVNVSFFSLFGLDPVT
jgi:hypothetical protein